MSRRRDRGTERMTETKSFAVFPTFPLLSSHTLPLAINLAILLYSAAPATAQLRDSFEGPQPTWSLTREADCGVRELAHDRSFRESRSGQASEHFRLQVGNGTYVYLAQSIGRAPVIQEFRPTLFVKADRPSLQLMARVVFPRSIDRGSGQPISSLLRGDMYTSVGEWQQLAIRDASKLLDQEARHLRTQFGPEIDPREDRKSTRLNSSHGYISYAVFCLK